MSLNFVFIDLEQVSIKMLVGWVKEHVAGDARFYFDLAELEHLNERERYIVFYPAPAQAIAALLVEGLSIADAMSTWRDAAQALLSFVRRKRDKVTLIDVATLDVDPNSVALALNPGGYNGGQTASQAGLSHGADPFWLLIGGEVLRRDRELGLMASEIAASTLGRHAGDKWADLEAVAAEQAAALKEVGRLSDALNEAEHARVALSTDLEGAQHELTTMLGQLVTTQTTLGQRDAALQQANHERQSLTKNLMRSSTDLEATQKALVEMQAQGKASETAIETLTERFSLERDALTRAIGQVEDALAKEKASAQDLLARIGAAEENAKKAAAETLVASDDRDLAKQALVHLENERAAQSREMDALTRAKQAESTALSHQLAEGRVEQDALLNELLRTQEDLATRQEEARQLEARLFQLQQGFEATEVQMRKQDASGAAQYADATRLSAEFRLISLTLSQRHREILAAQAEINRIKSSRSYRLTAPLRWLRRIVKKAQ